jgi:hypothetical protein
MSNSIMAFKFGSYIEHIYFANATTIVISCLGFHGHKIAVACKGHRKDLQLMLRLLDIAVYSRFMTLPPLSRNIHTLAGHVE